jgi:hypothetical protein
VVAGVGWEWPAEDGHDEWVAFGQIW